MSSRASCATPWCWRATRRISSSTICPRRPDHDQQSWNKGAYERYSGWAGRVLDAWYAGSAAPHPISPAITTTSDRDLVSAETLDVFQARSEGETWQGMTQLKQDAVLALADDASYAHVLERVAQRVFSSTVEGQQYLADLFGQLEASGKLTTAATVANKLIALADQLGHERQIIHVATPGGWDTHHDKFETLNDKYAVIDDLFADFIDELAMYGVADRVVCVTASDFGRSLIPNNRGTDHGWGSHQLVWGEPVLGGQAIGDFIDYDDPQQWTGSKRMIPKLADVQTYATLARWLGLGEADIDWAFPELRNFAQRDLGFMGA